MLRLHLTDGRTDCGHKQRLLFAPSKSTRLIHCMYRHSCRPEFQFCSLSRFVLVLQLDSVYGAYYDVWSNLLISIYTRALASDRYAHQKRTGRAATKRSVALANINKRSLPIRRDKLADLLENKKLSNKRKKNKEKKSELGFCTVSIPICIF